MIYNDFKGLKISALGFGSMRLPVIHDNEGKPNPEGTQQLVDISLKNGINYFDTAWGYHMGKAQVMLCDCLRRYDRDSYYLANKFPGYDLGNMTMAKEIFEEQLRLCKVDYFDFYLIHNVCELNIDAYLDPQYGIKDYFVEQVKNGRIKHLGFSAHGRIDVIKKFLEVYGDAMEFVMLQINYFDWEFQNVKDTVAFCREKGLAILGMEPLRGGKLANIEWRLVQEADIKKSKRDAVGLAFNFLQSVPGLLTVVTGMSSPRQALEKIQYYNEPRPLDAEEFEAAIELGRKIAAKTSIPCTACKYCVGKCPKGLDIPGLIYRYNEMLYNRDSFEFVTNMAMGALPKEKWPSACIGCGACSKVCPQIIDIPAVMKGFEKELEERKM